LAADGQPGILVPISSSNDTPGLGAAGGSLPSLLAGFEGSGGVGLLLVEIFLILVFLVPRQATFALSQRQP
jgi:hypothetical protein